MTKRQEQRKVLTKLAREVAATLPPCTGCGERPRAFVSWPHGTEPVQMFECCRKEDADGYVDCKVGVTLGAVTIDGWLDAHGKGKAL